MKKNLMVLAFMVALPCFAVDITTISGQTYSNVTIMRSEPDSLVAMTRKGICRIPFAEVSRELQVKYNYNPSNAAAYAQSKVIATQRAREIHAERLKQKEVNNDQYAVEVAARREAVKKQTEAQQKAARNAARRASGASIFEDE